MSALPKAVRAQVERSNQIATEYYKGLQPPVDSGTPPTPPNGETPPNPQGTPPTPPVPGEPPAGDPPPGTPPATAGEQEWEKKYRILQGKYNAEVPRLQRQLNEQTGQFRQMQEQLTATQTLLASLSAQRAAVPAAPAAPAQPARLIKDEEIKEYGADLVDVMRRVAREEHASLIPEIDRRVQPVAQQVSQVAQAAQNTQQRVAQQNRQSVFALLSEHVPNWEQLNGDSGFLEWLDQTDPYSNAQRGKLLEQAFNANDGPRVVAFFQGYQKEHAAVTPPAPSTPPAPPAAIPKKLGDFVAPGTPKAGSASTQDGSGKRVWTRAEISAFYSSLQSGSFKGTKEERAAYEADIFLAQKEGRIKP